MAATTYLTTYMRLYGFVTCVVCVLLSGCVTHTTTGHYSNDDVHLSGSVDQPLALDGVKEIVVRCYCPIRDVHQEPMDSIGKLHVEGVLQSTGYHGSQNKGQDALTQRLLFVERREGDTLFLDANELSYMHHTFGISAIRLTIPADRKVRIDPLSALDVQNKNAVE